MLFSLSSCQEKRQANQDLLGTLRAEKDTISWTLLPENDIIPAPRSMVVTDSVIGVLGLYDDFWVHTYDKLTGKLLSSKMHLGQGPGEIVQGFTMNCINDSLVGIYDYGQQNLITELLSSGKITETVSLSNIARVVLDAWGLSENKALVKYPVHLAEKKLSRAYVVYDLESKEIITDYQDLTDELADNLYALLTQSSLTLSPDKKHFAVSTFIGGALEFFELQDDSIRPVYSKIVHPVKFILKDHLMRPEGDPVFMFYGSCSTNDRVYIVYNCTTDAHEETKIAEWDWNGNLLRCYETGRPIYKLAYDPASDAIYGIVEGDEGPALAKLAL